MTKNKPPKAKKDQPKKVSIKPFPPHIQEILKVEEKALETDPQWVAWTPLDGNSEFETLHASPHIYASKAHLVDMAKFGGVFPDEYCTRSHPPLITLCGRELPGIDSTIDHHRNAPRGYCKRCMKKNGGQK